MDTGPCGTTAMPAAAPPTLTLLIAGGWPDYQLLDSGAGRRLERFGRFRFVRPEPQALWRPALPANAWEADGAFTGAEGASDGEDDGAGAEETLGSGERSSPAGRWRLGPRVPETWPIVFDTVRFHARCTPFRHLGFFPDQSPHWIWMRQQLITRAAARPQTQPRVLNLFGYSGVASLVAAAAGAAVTHVDASRKAIGHAAENQRLSGLDDRPIRWIVDDALKFVRREVRRGSRYDGIILDPPKFGRGPKGELWRLLEQLPDLLAACRDLLSPTPLFVILTVYAVRCSALSLDQCLRESLANRPGEVTSGEMAIREQSAGRLLPTALFARWQPAAGTPAGDPR